MFSACFFCLLFHFRFRFEGSRRVGLDFVGIAVVFGAGSLEGVGVVVMVIAVGAPLQLRLGFLLFGSCLSFERLLLEEVVMAVVMVVVVATGFVVGDCRKVCMQHSFHS